MRELEEKGIIPLSTLVGLMREEQEKEQKIRQVNDEVVNYIRQKIDFETFGFMEIEDEDLHRIIETVLRKAGQPHDEYKLYMNRDGIFMVVEDHLHNEQGVYIRTEYKDYYLDDILRIAKNIGMDYLERVLRALYDFLSSL
jgi:hypothetical protein